MVAREVSGAWLVSPNSRDKERNYLLWNQKVLVKLEFPGFFITVPYSLRMHRFYES
ncbi:hypothetical protein PAE9249_00659 [Paenibacillus sp. CECT 9249]|nr:hypothetical protein PAE9249_00659 [Paenibacillus sp. CECT 9249]